MQNTPQSSTRSNPPHPYRDLFGSPALKLNRRAQLQRKPIVALTDREKAYLEVRDLLDAYPDCTSDVLEAVADHERAGQRGGRRQ